MKRILMMCCAAAAMLAGAVSCEEPETGYEGTNYIYLNAESNSMFDLDNASITVNVTLTTALDQNLTLTLAMEENDYVELNGNPVTIPAGSTAASFTVDVTKQLPESEIGKNYTIALDNSTVLPENVVWNNDFTFTLMSSYVPELTDEQKEIIETYKTASGGIDLTKYIGLIPVTTVYTASSPDSEVALAPISITGYSKITLSEQSTSQQPVLEMIANAMGLQDILYNRLSTYTLNNPDWAPSEYAMSYSELLETIGWTATSNETFTVTLDGITPKSDKTVEFARTITTVDSYGDEVEQFKVPFEFYFSAYEREKEAIAANKIGSDVDPDWLSDATVNPDLNLNCDDVSEDWAEYGNWVECKATVAADKMEFTFCIYNYNDYDFTKVVATYTPNE